ncbi:MAG: glutamine cyclotransferase [Flavobacteriales bacterium]|nr:MAG: glutamine cyclotransferase [Flavobacteriales bacterium]
MHINPAFCVLYFTSLLLFSCAEEKKKEPASIQKPAVEKPKLPVLSVPVFNADSAYYYIEKQVDFGPRVPNTDAHRKCALWMENELKSYGLEVLVQEGEVTAFNKKKLQIKNIIGRFNAENPSRILLFAHWDVRPYADRDTKNRAKPIDGANDGGSGVGVLLEIARQLSLNEDTPRVGVDIIFFDAEDYGQPSETMAQQQGNTWCLGTQYWAKNPPIANYAPRYGILLDMVGATDAVFPQEAHSLYYAPYVVNNVWSTAARLGYSNYFVNKREYRGLTDDHFYVNTMAKIPSIDIVHYHVGKSDFGHFHHTHKDNMDIIDKSTLKAVGQTLLEVIYRES